MEVELVSATPDPEATVCRAARNDYLSEWMGDMDFDELMSEIDAEEKHQEAAQRLVEESYGDEESIGEDSYQHLLERETKKRTLISHLLDHGHFGPFEHVQATFAVKGISRSLMAQITRHRHATFDIQSMRYVKFDKTIDLDNGEAVVTIPELETAEPAGRNAEIHDDYSHRSDDWILDKRRELYESTIQNSFESYKELLRLGVAPENARMVLPIGTKVNMVFSVNARMLMHIGDMRAAGDAQWEIRQMTEEVLDLAEEWCPHTFSYYNENLKNRKNRLAP